MLKRRFVQCLTSVVMLVGLSACAVAPKPAVTTAAEQFQRSGRFALSVDNADGKKDAVQGGFQWSQTAHQLQLDLNNPMGAILARVVVTTQGAMLQYPDGQVEYASSPDALVEQLIGYVIPVEGMRDWLQGQTGAGSVSELKMEQGKPSYFQQDGWRVRMQRYDDAGPRLLQMNRNQAQQSISVRVVVDY